VLAKRSDNRTPIYPTDLNFNPTRPGCRHTRMQCRVPRSKLRSNCAGKGTLSGSNRLAPRGDKSRTAHSTLECPLRQIMPSTGTRNLCRGFIRRSMPDCMIETSWRGVTRPLTRAKNHGAFTAGVSGLAGRLPAQLYGLLDFRQTFRPRFASVGAMQPSASGFCDTARGFRRRLIICSPFFCRPSVCRSRVRGNYGTGLRCRHRRTVRPGSCPRLSRFRV
jgi:hypothetical protein